MTAIFSLLIFIVCLLIIYVVVRRIQTFYVCKEIPGTPLTAVTFFIGDPQLLRALTSGRLDVVLEELWSKHDTDVYRGVGMLSFEPLFYFRNLEPWFRDKKIPKDRRTTGMLKFIPFSLLAAPSIGKNSEVEVWATHRRVVAGLLGQKQVRQHYPKIEASVIRWLKVNSGDKEIEITPKLQDLALEIFGTTMFGFDILQHKKTNDEFHIATGALLKHTLGAAFIGKLYQLWMWRSIRDMNATFSRVISAALESDTNGNNLCSALKNEHAFSEQEIKDEMVGLFVAGHETTANTLSWTLYLLAVNPEIQQKAKAEIKKDFKNGEISFDSVKKNDLLLRIFHETMRIVPTVYLIARDLKQSMEYTYKEKHRLTFPKGSFVGWMRPSQDYKSFDPWANSLSEITDTALPFHLGRRKCVGYRFAEVEACVFLLHLLLNYTVTSTGKEPTPMLRITNKPHNLFLKLTRDPERVSAVIG